MTKEHAWYPIREVWEFVEGSSWARLSVQRVGRDEPAYEWTLTQSYNGGAYWSMIGRAASIEECRRQADMILDGTGGRRP